MKQKLNLFVIIMILVLPVTLYALFKAPQNAVAHANEQVMPVVMEFSSPLCSECQKLKKVLDVVEPKYADRIIFKKISANIMDEEANEQIQKYSVRVVPTTVFINRQGKVVAKKEGSMPKQVLEKQLNELLQ